MKLTYRGINYEYNPVKIEFEDRSYCQYNGVIAVSSYIFFRL